MSMKIVLIPLALLLFVFIYPFAEYNIDCPTGLADPRGNEDCTWTKMMFWEAVEVLSFTEYGFPPDRMFFAQEVNPDAWESQSVIPMLLATAVTICLVKVREHEKEKQKNKLRELR